MRRVPDADLQRLGAAKQRTSGSVHFFRDLSGCLHGDACSKPGKFDGLAFRGFGV